MLQQKSDHITKIRQAARQLISSINELMLLKREWDALDLGTNLTQEYFIGANEDLTPEDIVSVYVTLSAFEGLLVQGHATNLYKVT